MKKIISVIALCGVILTLNGCGKTEQESSSVSVPNVSIPDTGSTDSQTSTEASNGTSSATSDETSSTTSDETSSQTSSEPVIEYPIVDEPNNVSGIHDLSNGNGVYNPNITDTSNTRRYYGDFKWTSSPKTLWVSDIDEVPWPVYDWDAAVAYGKAHWDDGVGLCAPFVSKCITTGNITNYTESSTAITLQLLHSRLGFGQFVEYNKYDHTITLPEYARPGDVIQIYCSYEGMMIHSLLMVGTDSEGKLRVVCHNLRNSGQSTFHVDHYNDPCYDCASETVEVFFYHFFRDEDEGLPAEIVNNKDILLWEEKAYSIGGETYDREAALNYARTYHEDGLGYYGASHTSQILLAGGISVGYPNQSALFLQLLKSHHGTAYSQRIREDRTVILPENARAGDIGFVYCPNDGIITSSFIISGRDDTGRMITLSYDLLNDGTSAHRIENRCVGCGAEQKELIVYCFED